MIERMKILVIDTVIETKDIADIVDIEADKTMFLNREAGFKIIFLDNTVFVFGVTIPYESSPRDISEKKNEWRLLMEKCIQEWSKDKTEIASIKNN